MRVTPSTKSTGISERRISSFVERLLQVVGRNRCVSSQLRTPIPEIGHTGGEEGLGGKRFSDIAESLRVDADAVGAEGEEELELGRPFGHFVGQQVSFIYFVGRVVQQVGMGAPKSVVGNGAQNAQARTLVSSGDRTERTRDGRGPRVGFETIEIPAA